MPPAEILIPFFLAAAVFACVPGPGNLYAAAQTLALGRRAGWLSALGFHIAGFGQVAAAAVGVSALLAVVPALFTVMKLAGAVYLVVLGIKYLRSGPMALSAVRGSAAAKALRHSILVELVNPKSALFHLAFLPQFADASAALPVWAQIVVLGLVVNVMFTITDGVVIEASHALSARLRSSERFLLLLRRIGGGLLIGIGVNLAFARNA